MCIVLLRSSTGTKLGGSLALPIYGMRPGGRGSRRAKGNVDYQKTEQTRRDSAILSVSKDAVGDGRLRAFVAVVSTAGQIERNYI